MPAAAPDRTPFLRRLFAASLLLLAFGALVHPAGDPDLYIHLRDGRYLWEQRFQVDNDPFSYTAADRPFERAEWLFRAPAYLAWRLGGFPLLILLKALAMTAALGLLGWLAYRRWRNLGGVALLLAAGALAPSAALFPVRPYVFTYLLLPLVMVMLERARAGVETELRRLWWIPVLVIPWANLHPGFMIVFAFLGAHALEALLAWWREWRAPARRRGLAVTGAAVLAGAATPMGFALYPFTLEILNSSDYMRFLTEWAPPTPTGEPVFFGLLAAAGIAALAGWRRLRLSDFLPALATAFMAVKSYRNIPLFVIAAVPLLADLAGTAWQRLRRPLPAAWTRAGLIGGSASTLVLLAGLTLAGRAFRTGEIPRFYPEAGLAWYEAQGVRGRLLTHDIWGGYTGWRTRGRVKIFMDGRLPTFGEALYADYRRMIWGDGQACLPLLDRYHIQAVLVSPKNEPRLFQRLWGSGAWALVYWDDVCLLYLRRDGSNAALAEARAYRRVDPKRTPFFHPEHPAEALAEVRRAAAEAPDSFLPFYFEGELLLRLEDPGAARKALRRALVLAPNHAASHLSLGVAALGEHDPAAAEPHLRRALALGGAGRLRGMAAYHLARLLGAEPARRNEARRWAAEARDALPGWEPARRLAEETAR